MPQKGREKRTLIDWRTVAGRLCNGNEQEATTQEMMLYNRRGTFTQPHWAAKWKTGYSSVDRGEREENKGIVWVFGVKAGIKRGVWETHRQAERMEVFCLAGRTNVRGHRKSFV